MSRLYLGLLAGAAVLAGCASDRNVYEGRNQRYGLDRNDTFWTRSRDGCDATEQVCYKDGQPDRSDTRDAFGKKAARRLDRN